MIRTCTTLRHHKSVPPLSAGLTPASRVPWLLTAFSSGAPHRVFHKSSYPPHRRITTQPSIHMPHTHSTKGRRVNPTRRKNTSGHDITPTPSDLPDTRIKWSRCITFHISRDDAISAHRSQPRPFHRDGKRARPRRRAAAPPHALRAHNRAQPGSAQPYGTGTYKSCYASHAATDAGHGGLRDTTVHDRSRDDGSIHVLPNLTQKALRGQHGLTPGPITHIHTRPIISPQVAPLATQTVYPGVPGQLPLTP